MDSVQLMIRDRLAAKVFERIQGDRARTKRKQVTDVLNYIKEHLFDPDLSLYRAYDECKVDIGYISQRFNSDIGDTPKQYLRNRRIDVGAELLIRTTLVLLCQSTLNT